MSARSPGTIASSRPGAATTRTPGMWPRPPSRIRAPPSESAPLAIQGVVAPPRERGLEPRLRFVLEAGGVQPDPAVGVLGAPVVAGGRTPADDLLHARVEHDAAAGDAVGHRRLDL